MKIGWSLKYITFFIKVSSQAHFWNIMELFIPIKFHNNNYTIITHEWIITPSTTFCKNYEKDALELLEKSWRNISLVFIVIHLAGSDIALYCINVLTTSISV